ncbi:MAG: hypothetical protein R3B99_24360 [Polyangiales bacterium]
MRRWFSLVLLLAACGDDGVGLFADVQWQVRCPGDLAGCSRDGEPVDVFASEGDDGFNIACEVDESGGLRFVNFQRVDRRTASAGHRPQTGVDGGAVTGTGCRVTIVDDSTTYEGACGSSAPSASQPCQITGLSFIEDRVGDTDVGSYGPELQMSMSCQGFRAAAARWGFRRYV